MRHNNPLPLRFALTKRKKERNVREALQRREREEIRCTERNQREVEKVWWSREKVGNKEALLFLNGLILLLHFLSIKKDSWHDLVGDCSVADTVGHVGDML
jgi:hypothetical protein